MPAVARRTIRSLGRIRLKRAEEGGEARRSQRGVTDPSTTERGNPGEASEETIGKKFKKTKQEAHVQVEKPTMSRTPK